MKVCEYVQNLITNYALYTYDNVMIVHDDVFKCINMDTGSVVVSPPEIVQVCSGDIVLI